MTKEQRIADLERRIAELRRMDEDEYHGFMTVVRLETIERLTAEISALKDKP